MIIDQFGVFFDDEKASATMTSKSIHAMPYAGRQEPVYISFLAKGANTADVTFTIDVQESADNSTFSSLETFTIHKPDATSVLSAFRLPLATKESHIRLVVTVSGSTTGVTLFAGVTRDHFAPYDKGLYIRNGKVEQ